MTHKEQHMPDKGHKKKPTLLIIIAVVILIPILVLGYLGFVPVVSDLMGATKPKDLGVKWTEANLHSASAKLGRTRGTLPAGVTPENSLRFEGSHQVDSEFSSEEVTATMQSRDYKYNPVGEDFQAKFTGNEVEMSGTLNIGNFRNYAKASKVPEDQVETVMSKASLIKVNPSFYVKGTGRVINNRLTYDVQKVEIGRVSVPVEAFPEGAVSRFVEERIESIPGLSVESLAVEDGKLRFKGTYPDKSYYDTGE